MHRDLRPSEQPLWAAQGLPIPVFLTRGANLAASVSERHRTSLWGGGKGHGGFRSLSL